MNEERIRKIFVLSVCLKGLHALIECVGGIILWVVSRKSISAVVNMLTQEELIEDPNDFIANHLRTFTHNFSVSSKHFYAFYLLSHGIVKVFLVAGLLKNQLWAYPSSLVVLGLFIVYQLYRFTYTHSAGLLALTAFDLIVVVLIWHEYRLMRRRTPR